ncbi:MAG: type II toxin-antitoxin system RelE/ParE family toxin [Chlorobi bacterium]|nr:type II toxin-antitoxin system RelE/ParE family toxin [Chlorobiota bacterium]
MDYKIFWTEEAIHNLEEIIDYLSTRWTQREIDKFKSKLSKQIDLIKRNPRMFPVSTFQPRLRKAVLSRETSVFYETIDNVIYITYVFVNHKSTLRLK